MKQRGTICLMSLALALVVLILWYSVVSPSAIQKGWQVRSLSNLKQLDIALLMYAQDYNDHLPALNDAAALQSALRPLVQNAALFVEPVMWTHYQPNPALSGKNLDALSAPSKTILLYEPLRYGDGKRGVGFADGHCKILSESEFSRLWQTGGAGVSSPKTLFSQSDFNRLEFQRRLLNSMSYYIGLWLLGVCLVVYIMVCIAALIKGERAAKSANVARRNA